MGERKEGKKRENKENEKENLGVREAGNFHDRVSPLLPDESFTKCLNKGGVSQRQARLPYKG